MRHALEFSDDNLSKCFMDATCYIKYLQRGLPVSALNYGAAGCLRSITVDSASQSWRINDRDRDHRNLLGKLFSSVASATQK